MGLPVRDVSEVHCQRSVHRHQLKALLELLEILAQISSKKPQLGQEPTPKAWGYRVTDATGNQSPPVIPAGVWQCFFLVHLEHPVVGVGRWLLFALRKESRIGIVSAVWVGVLLGLMGSEGRNQSEMALEGELSPDIAKSCFLNTPLQEREEEGGVLHGGLGLHTNRPSWHPRS